MNRVVWKYGLRLREQGRAKICSVVALVQKKMASSAKYDKVSFRRGLRIQARNIESSDHVQCLRTRSASARKLAKVLIEKAGEQNRLGSEGPRVARTAALDFAGTISGLRNIRLEIDEAILVLEQLAVRIPEKSE